METPRPMANLLLLVPSSSSSSVRFFNTNIIVYVFTELPHIMGHPQGKEDRFADRYSHK